MPKPGEDRVAVAGDIVRAVTRFGTISTTLCIVTKRYQYVLMVAFVVE
jgi:hypothetical protein